MDKVAIVFWTGSGNTEAMAQAVEEGAKNAGAETVLNFVGDTSAAELLIRLSLAARLWAMKAWKNTISNHFSKNCSRTWLARR